MTDNKPFIVTPYAHRPRTPWKLEIRKSFAGKKICRFFSDEAAAWQEGEALALQIRERGLSSVGTRGITVGMAVCRFQDARKLNGQHGAHMERNLALFVQRFKNRGISLALFLA